MKLRDFKLTSLITISARASLASDLLLSTATKVGKTAAGRTSYLMYLLIANRLAAELSFTSLRETGEGSDSPRTQGRLLATTSTQVLREPGFKGLASLAAMAKDCQGDNICPKIQSSLFP